MIKSRYWIDLTTAEAAALPPDTVAVLPVAAVEQHGPHLPVGTDAIINRGIIVEALELIDAETPVLVLPEQTVGASDEHLSFPGTLSHRPIDLIGIWTRLIESVHRAGVRKALLFNSHGGQIHLMQPVALDLRRRHHMIVAYASWFDVGLPEGLFSDAEARFGIHGGAIETSMVMHLRPELVVESRIDDFPSTSETMARSFKRLSADPGGGILAGFGWMSQDLNVHGVMGDARKATAEAGQALVHHAAIGLAELIRELVALPIETLRARTFLDEKG